MELRKLIGFGKATYSITLPKKWVKDNALVKGDLILIQEKSPEKLEISPKFTEQQELLKEATLDVTNKSLNELERNLITAYINDCSLITIVGDRKDKTGEIRSMVNELIGLEIMEISKEKIVTRVFSDVTNTHADNIIRRISLVTKTMFEELEVILNGGIDYHVLTDNDREINRQTYFVRRILLKAIKSAYFRGAIKMELAEAVCGLRVVNSVERIGDQIKIMGEQLCNTMMLQKLKAKPEEKKTFIAFTKRIQKIYEGATKAYLTKDRVVADETIKEVQVIRIGIEEYMKAHCHSPVAYVCANLGVMVHQIGDLAMVVLDLEC